MRPNLICIKKSESEGVVKVEEESVENWEKLGYKRTGGVMVFDEKLNAWVQGENKSESKGSGKKSAAKD